MSKLEFIADLATLGDKHPNYAGFVEHCLGRVLAGDIPRKENQAETSDRLPTVEDVAAVMGTYSVKAWWQWLEGLSEAGKDEAYRIRRDAWKVLHGELLSESKR